MSGDDDEQSSNDDEQSSSEDTRNEQEASSDTPELSEEGKETVQRMASAYEDRETAVLPGTGRTITGTAVNEWLDDEGNPKFGKEKQQEKEQQQEHEGQQEREGEQENA
jgi:hypothetical protein